jgi:hypothetical protein
VNGGIHLITHVGQVEKLTEHQKADIQLILSKLSNDDLAQLFECIEMAFFMDKGLNSNEHDRWKAANVLSSLKELEGHLKKAAKLINAIPGFGGTLDYHYESENKHKVLQDYAQLKKKEFGPIFSGTMEWQKNRNQISGSHEILKGLCNAAISWREKVKAPGEKSPKGRPRATAHRYFIGMIAHHFRFRITHYRVSAARDSCFYKLIVYLFEHVLCLPVTDPERHIKAGISGWK